MSYPTAEVLRERAETISNGLSDAVKNGLDLDLLRYLESEVKEGHERHRDLLMVHLGLKPMASYLESVLAIYQSAPDYLPYLQSNNLGLNIIAEGDTVWNIGWEQELLNENQDLLSAIRSQLPESKNYPTYPRHGSFKKFVDFLSEQDEPKEAIALEGVLLGYPREAAFRFGAYYLSLSSLKNHVGNFLKNQGINSRLQNPMSLQSLVKNEYGAMDELLETLDRLPRKIPDWLDEVIRNIRLAEVPGTQYFTFGADTEKDEKALTDAYEASGMEEKLLNILISH